MLLFQAWEQDYGVSPIESATNNQEQPVQQMAPTSDEGVPTAPATDGSLPQAPRIGGDTAVAEGDTKVRVTTDVFDLVDPTAVEQEVLISIRCLSPCLRQEL